MNNKKVHIISLGCPKNLIDSEVMAALLSASGFNITSVIDNADIIIVNTCTFILPAKEESIEEILRSAAWKKEKPDVRLIVAGCLPQRYGKTLEKELPEIDLFLGTSEIPHIARYVEMLLLKEAPASRSIIPKPRFLMDASHPRLLATPSYSAYLKIAEGCSNYCSYCVVPAIRGKARSRNIDDILKEAKTLAGGGVKEIIIIAQDTTAYGRDLKSKPTLSNLLRKLTSIEGIHWIRLLYTYPAKLSREILQTITEEEKICNYLDIPIQHIDVAILETMNRQGRSKLIHDVIREARNIIPGLALRTSVIMGFPGETPAKFKKLLAFIKEARFDHLGAFKYSREEGTAAAALPSQVSEKVKESRRHMIMEEQAIISWEINQSLIGTYQQVLVEGKSDIPDFAFIGRCRRQAPDIDGITYIKGKNLAPGDFLECRITAAGEYDLFAEVSMTQGFTGK